MTDLQAKAVLSAEDRASAVLAMVARNFDKLNAAADRMNRVDARSIAGASALERRASAAERIATATRTMATRIAPVVGPAAAAAIALKAAKAYSEQERAMTRIAITGDATRAQQDEAALSVERLADKTGLATNTIREGLDSLVSAGRSLPDAMAFLPTVARTAQASGAQVVDIARSADAVSSSLGISAGRMENAFDLMAAAGKEGKFELKDMARYLPSLAAGASQLGGFKGEEGLKQLVAMLQIVRAQTGTSEEAATNLGNIFAKLDSDETRNKFKEMGVDSAKAMEQARKEGRNLVEVMGELVQQATKGDLSKIPRLFQDMQVQKGIIALTSQSDAYRRMLEKLGNVSGTVERDFQRVVKDQQTGWDRISNSAGRFVRNLGNIPAVNGALNGTADAVNRINAAMERGDEIRRRLDDAGIKPVAKSTTEAQRDAERAIAIAKFLNDPGTASLPDADDSFGSERRRKAGPDRRTSAQRVQDAFDEVQRARAAVRAEDESRRRQEMARLVQERAREAEDIAAATGGYGDALGQARAQVGAQRAQGDTPATLNSASGQNAARAADILQSFAYAIQRMESGGFGMTEADRSRRMEDLKATVGEIMDIQRRQTGGATPTDAEIAGAVKALVDAAEGLGKKGRAGEVDAARVEDAARGDIKAKVEPDQITAKTEVSFSGGISVQVNPGSELISLTTQMKQIIARGGSNGAVSTLSGQATP